MPTENTKTTEQQQGQTATLGTNKPIPQPNTDLPGQTGQPGAATEQEPWRPGDDPAGQPSTEQAATQEEDLEPLADDAARNRSQGAGGSGGF